MGECCSNQNYPEEKKIYNSFKKIEKENNIEFNIINYDEKCEEIYQLTKNKIRKLGFLQSLRVNFIQELRRDIYNLIEKDSNYSQDYSGINNNYKKHYLLNNTNDFRNNETQKILYYIIIMKLVLQNSLKGNFISNKLEKSLLELSVIILKKTYIKEDLKLILFYLSKMFEILFKNMHNIEAYLNLSDYLSKIKFITDDHNILEKKEKYLFIKSHIISLGEWFHNDSKIIIMQDSERSLLFKYYAYLIVKNYSFIINNYSNYKHIMPQKHHEINSIILDENYYNKNDLIVGDNVIDDNFKKNEKDIIEIFYSINYFFIICSEDTFSGKNIFNEFNNNLNQEIIRNNLQSDPNLIKFNKSIFSIISKNLLIHENSSAALFSLAGYIFEMKKFDIRDFNIYHEMAICLYGRFNNNWIFIDKYSYFITRIFLLEIERNIKEKLVIDELYTYINEKNSINNYSNHNSEKNNSKYYENISFLINLIKNISSSFTSPNYSQFVNEILIFLNNLIHKIRRDYKNKIIDNNKYLFENINETMKYSNFYKNNFELVNSFRNIHIPLATFLSSYILMINDLFIINSNEMAKEYDFGIINAIMIIEINIIKNNNNSKYLNIIINLLNKYINYLNTKEIIDCEDINNSLKFKLRLIKNEIRASPNIQLTSFHPKLIYIILIIIYIAINNKNSSEHQILISKHNKILKAINQLHSIIYSCFQNLSDIKIINLKNFLNILNGPVYAIKYITFKHLINIFLKELFDEEEDDVSQYSYKNFRARTLYQNDKNSEISININTNNNPHYNNRTHKLNNNYIINESFSKYSSNTFSHRKYSETILSNYSNNYNNDMNSEKIRIPFRDNINNNNININDTFSINNINTNEDIISNKSSICSFKMKI